jgi:hypothetical protein
MGVLHIILCPLQCTFVMINTIIVVHIVQLSVAQEAQFGAAATKVAVPIVHITEARGAAIVWPRAHVRIVSLTAAQDAAVPFGTLLIDMVSAVTIPGIRAGRPDRPGQATQTKTRGTARTAMRQKRYDESTFSARLAEALRRHGVAVRTARTSSSVIRDITDQLARHTSTGRKSNSDEDVRARHGPHGPERPPRR